mmetsp:Transcript_73377/g.237331  ORF Transcript_73377/g.237331 Transcript_73377/m.237331 type:complete len:166 (+) Transcript_73377:62-559(+)
MVREVGLVPWLLMTAMAPGRGWSPLPGHRGAAAEGIFACETHEVYADVVTSLGGFVTRKLVDVDDNWKFAKRKLTGEFVNTGVCQAWVAIGSAGVHSSYDWTSLADTDVVFFVDGLILRSKLLPVALVQLPVVDWCLFMHNIAQLGGCLCMLHEVLQSTVAIACI